MKNRKVKNVQVGNFTIYLGIILVFISAFIILIDRHYNNEYLADVVNNEFIYRTIPGKQIVVRDMNAIYPKYFIIYFDNTDNTYIAHVMHYYQTDSQYELEYYNNLDSIIDYNYDDYMIRCLYKKGHGTYQDVLEELSFLINSDNYKLY